MAEQEPVYRFVAENATTCRQILERGGCDRCALRHCAPPWALYDAAPATLRGALRSALDVPQNEGCALCLGALAETTARAVVSARAPRQRAQPSFCGTSSADRSAPRSVAGAAS